MPTLRLAPLFANYQQLSIMLIRLEMPRCSELVGGAQGPIAITMHILPTVGFAEERPGKCPQAPPITIYDVSKA